MTAHRRSKSAPFKVWAGVALVALALALLPFVAALAGQAWVRILNFAMIYIMLALGLNIVVGFAGLLDLGYIAFYAVGAYMYALLASPHFSIHLPFWSILPLGAGLACIFGVLLGAPKMHASPAPSGRIAQNGRWMLKCGDASSAYMYAPTA